MKRTDHRSHHERWAHLRFAVIGQLLAAPPPKGELRRQRARRPAGERRLACLTVDRAVIAELGPGLGPDVLRPSPDGAALRLTFARTERRTQRRSDGTVVIDAHRFEVPNAFRHLDRVLVRYARWDLSQVHLVDEHSGQISARLYPLDKAANANGIRRPLEPVATRDAAGSGAHVTPATGIAPLLQNLMTKQRATGLPPPYLRQVERPDTDYEGENP